MIPHLGFYVGQEKNSPVDYDELLISIRPRPALVVAPELDRYAHVDDVRRIVASANKHNAAVELRTPLDYNRLPPATQKSVADWLERTAAGAHQAR